MPPEKKMDLLSPAKLLDRSMEQKSPLRSPTMRKSKSRSPNKSPLVMQKSIRRKTMNVPNLARKSFLNPRNQREDVTGTMLSNEINMFGHKSSVSGSEANSGGTKFGSRSFRGVNFETMGDTYISLKAAAKEEKELKRLAAIAYSARLNAEKKQDTKWDPWQCFIERKKKQKYPWQDFENQERIIATPTR